MASTPNDGRIRFTGTGKLAAPIQNHQTGKWEVTEFGVDGEMLKVYEYDTKEEAKRQLDLAVLGHIQHQSGRMEAGENAGTENRQSLAQEFGDGSDFLSRTIDQFGGALGGERQDTGERSSFSKGKKKEYQSPFEEETEARKKDREEKLKAFDEEYDAEEAQCRKRAKELLESVALIFLQTKTIPEESYLSHKLSLEEESLSSLLFQLKTSRRAIHKLMQDIHLGKAHPRVYEVLAQLQKIVLDISKFQHEYLLSVENSMKLMHDDVKSRNLSPMEHDAPIEVEGKPALLLTRHRGQLIKELKDVVDEAGVKVAQAPPSRNLRLLGDGESPDVTEYEDEMSGNDGSVNAAAHGLNTFSEEVYTDRPKRKIETQAEDDDDDDFGEFPGEEQEFDSDDDDDI